MSTKVVKELSEKVAQSVDSTLKDIRDDVKGTTGSVAMQTLEKLAEVYEAANVAIYRIPENKNKFALFVELEGVPLEDLMGRSLEALCKHEGGAGDYRVEVIVPAKQPGKSPTRLKYGPFTVIGAETLPIARSELAKRQSDPAYFNPFASMMGLPAQTAQTKDQSVPYIRDMLKYIGDSSHKSNEQSQNLMSNMMQMMFMTMFKDQVPGAQQRNASDTVLEQRFAALERQMQDERQQRESKEELRKHEERIRESEARSEQRYRDILSRLDNSGTSQTLELMKLQQAQGSSKDDSFIKFLTLSREENREGQKRFDTLLSKMIERPQENPLGMYQEMLQSNLKNNVDMLNLMTQIAASGLTGGNNEPWYADAIRETIGSIREGVAAYGNLKQALEGGLPEDEAVPQIEAPPTEVQQLPARGSQSSPSVPPPPATETGPTPDQMILGPDELKQLLLTKQELESLGKDRGAQQIFKALEERGDVHEASARIFGLARAERESCQRWFSAPGPLSGQILTHYDLPEYMLSLTQNLLEFHQFLERGGDPNQWSDAYQPIKPAKKKGEAMKSGPGTDFGMQQGQPADGEMVDSSQVPPGIDPALAEKQRAERALRDKIEHLEMIKENIEALRAGKLARPRVEVLRKDGLLPPDGQEQAALEELKIALQELRGETLGDSVEDPTS
ncbi:MAG: hypothetical protein ACYTBJ_00010 [Planctomycetota bacterium]